MAHTTIAEPHEWRGTIVVTTRDARGRFTSRRTFHNLITDDGHNLARDFLSGASTDGKIRYVALGSSNTAVAAAQHQLVAEQFRKAVTARSNPGTGQAKTTVYIAPTEANSTSFTINEIGWFATPTANAAANSGVMVARVLYNRAKASTESLQIDRIDTFS